ncbi:protein of unknown function [Methanoculleus bourgensis]|uniref:Uncharacterized protein n=1 Tax=Methanoculleus bourgensis TaxID=83986 RepID=A0A0X3BQT5_9EURY|nr:protein of unknown function [Methanoculleus bourgensis]
MIIVSGAARHARDPGADAAGGSDGWGMRACCGSGPNGHPNLISMESSGSVPSCPEYGFFFWGRGR